MSAVCVCAGEGRNLRPCLYHYSHLRPDQQSRILTRLGIDNPRPARRS